MDEQLVILVVGVGHRREIYRGNVLTDPAATPGQDSTRRRKLRSPIARNTAAKAITTG